MQKKKFINEDIPIGREIAMLRVLLNFTQQQFADTLHLSRASVCKLERIADSKDIPLDIAFRLFYVTQKLADNANKEIYITDTAENLHNRIDVCLQKQMKS